MPPGEQVGRVPGEGPDLVERGAAVEPDQDVQAARAGGHQVGGEGEFVQQDAQRAGGGPDRFEVLARRVEVEDQQVGVVGPVGPGEPAVRGDAGLADQVEQGGQVVADRVVDGAARLGQLAAVDPLREVPGGVLLHDPRAVDAVGVALQHQRPAAQLRQDAAGDAAVVRGQVGLGEAVGREQLLVGPPDLDDPPARPDLGGGHGAPRSRPAGAGRPCSRGPGRGGPRPPRAGPAPVRPRLPRRGGPDTRGGGGPGVGRAGSGSRAAEDRQTDGRPRAARQRYRDGGGR